MQLQRAQFAYLLAVALASVSVGAQLVVLPWLGVSALSLSPSALGLLQGAVLVPQLLLLLLGGVLADRRDNRRWLFQLYLILALPHLALGLLLKFTALNLPVLLLYALALGSLAAMIQPCRDNLMHRISGSNIQRWVTGMALVQFTAQSAGFWLAGQLDRWGQSQVLFCQSTLLMLSALAVLTLPRGQALAQPRENIHQALLSGLDEVKKQPVLRQLLPLIAFNGFFSMGLYMVIMPLLVKHFLDQGADFYAMTQLCFAAGTVGVTLFIVLGKGVKHPGKWLALAIFGSGLLMISIATKLTAFRLLWQCGCWGVLAGISMSMGRSLLQEVAPEGQRSRIISLYQLALFGSAPLGALCAGFLVEQWGILLLLKSAGGFALGVFALTLLATALWRFESRSGDSAQG